MVLCQITTQDVRDSYAISLRQEDFNTGTLHRPSNIRPNRLFTADSHIVLYRVGHIKHEKLEQVVEQVINILKLKNTT